MAGAATIIPEARTDIAVSMPRRLADFPVRLSRSGETTIIDGGLDRRVHGCSRPPGGPLAVRIRDRGMVAMADLPKVVARVPLDARITISDGVSGVVGRSRSLEFENRGCGDWTVANVGGRLRFDQLGSGAARIGAVAEATLNLDGAGSIRLRAVGGPLTAVSSGRGTIFVGRASGPVVARVAGSGAIDIATGTAPKLNASVAGSGDIRFGGVAGEVTASVAGPGAINIARARGSVSRRVFGAGRIVAGR
jgi:hypothetical protein